MLEAAAPETPAIRVAEVSHAYERAPVLRDVSLSAAPGEIVALLGANGAGKTTLLRLVATLDQPLRGKVTVCGLDGRTERRAVRARVGFVAHPPLLYPDLTVSENLRFFGALFGRRMTAQAIEELLAAHRLAGLADARVRRLSHGLVRRVAIARACLHEPDVLLLDEPHSGLDEAAANALDERLVAFAAGGGAVLLASHDTARVGALAHRAVRLVDGRLAAGAPLAQRAGVADDAVAPPPPAPTKAPPQPSFVRSLAAIAAKDLRVELRARDGLPLTMVFAVLLVVLFHFALPRTLGGGAVATAFAHFPAVLWISLMLATTVGLHRTAAAETEAAGAWGLLLSAADPGAIFLGKWSAALVTGSVVAIATWVSAVVFLEIPGVPVGPTLAITLLGLVGWTATAVVVTALIAGSRAREGLAPLLLYPLAVPLLVAAVVATEAVLTTGATTLAAAVTLLVAYDVIFMVLGFLAFAFAWESAQ